MEFRKPKPIYKQIATYIIYQILENNWADGQRIPSVRELASDIEVNPNTVARTYNLLSDEGIICLLYTSPSPRDATLSRMPSSA